MVYKNNSLNNTANEDFLVTTATAGIDRAISITNTDNSAAASAAHIQVTVGGTTSTGDPYVNFNIPGGSTYSVGIDNSDSDKLKTTTGASPSAGTTLSELFTAAFTLNVPTLAMANTPSAPGPVHQYIDNGNGSDDTCTVFHSLRAHSGGGDAYYEFGTNTVPRFWCIGQDTSDTYALKINLANAFVSPSSGTNVLKIDRSGNTSITTGNFDVTHDTSGAGTVLATISNISNTAAASNAKLLVQVGGTTSTGDPFINFNVPGGSTWSIGADNSDTDNFKISASSALGTTDYFIIQTASNAGSVVVPTDLTVGQGNFGNSQGIISGRISSAAKWASGNWIRPCFDGKDESQNTASTAIGLTSRTDNGGNYGFALINVPGNTSGTLYFAGAYTGSSQPPYATLASLDSDGDFLLPLQPAFSAYRSASTANVTGDGTAYTVSYDTEIFDQNADFATPNFTAPVTGRYCLNFQCQYSNIGAGHTTGYTNIVTSNRTYAPGCYCSPAAIKAADGNFSEFLSCFADMDAGDTAYTTLVVSGSTKTITIQGSAPNVNFSGYLVC